MDDLLSRLFFLNMQLKSFESLTSFHSSTFLFPFLKASWPSADWHERLYATENKIFHFLWKFTAQTGSVSVGPWLELLSKLQQFSSLLCNAGTSSLCSAITGPSYQQDEDVIGSRVWLNKCKCGTHGSRCSRSLKDERLSQTVCRFEWKRKLAGFFFPVLKFTTWLLGK